MALDSREKRQSVIHHSMPWFGPAHEPASLTTGARRQSTVNVTYTPLAGGGITAELMPPLMFNTMGGTP